MLRPTGDLTPLIPLAALAMRLGSSETASISYLILAGYALLGREQVLQALALAWLFTMLSEGVAPLTGELAIGRYAVFAASAITLVLRSGLAKEWFSISRPALATLGLGVFLVLHSMLFSNLPEISILRAFLWMIVTVTLVSAWLGLPSEARVRVERQFFFGLILLVLVSIPFAFTSIGYLRNNTGFQGVLSHPQVFGPVVALLGAWLAGRLLSSSGSRWQDVALLVLCLVLVVLSESRTAGYALILGLLGAVLFSPLLSGTSAWRMMPGLTNRWIHGLALIAVIGIVFAKPVLSGRLNDYIDKRTDLAGLFDAPKLSRGPLMERMMSNFEEEPLTGVGFGIASDFLSMDIVIHPVLGLPLSAPVEKGVLPIAVLEELGVCGFLLVSLWVWLMVRRAAQRGVAAFAVVAVILLTNLAEAALFSPGGLGLLQLILLTWAITCPAQRLQIPARI